MANNELALMLRLASSALYVHQNQYEGGMSFLNMCHGAKIQHSDRILLQWFELITNTAEAFYDEHMTTAEATQ